MTLNLFLLLNFTGLRPFICYNANFSVSLVFSWLLLLITVTIKRSQTMRLQVMSDGSVFDPVVQLSILEQMKQKLKEKGMLENTTVTWRLQPDGNIFQKIKDDL
ncbi:hypothetical protein KOW79_022737 [Hemibagrus wyckioides]|uniref:Uncharacterized protein n=1 Tax=Hemibagrus wyckioides TaxID=337641 RepID=A0A9D3S7M6_9TELE|nr:hypothetical protein KOW79_022737 [Hemibagrus wyckioides]